MKRFTVMAWMIALIAVGSYVVFARPVSPAGSGAGQTCPASAIVAGAMTQRALFATPELGIIVLVGDKLMRFDSQLNKIGETEIQVDMAQMQRRIEQAMQTYSPTPQPIEVQQETAESL
jgi:hypothetical protein